jgi:raffinose/stachyose/melibiose transport system substrate-binding protein
MKSKFVALLLVAAMLCLALIGCAPKGTTEPEAATTEPTQEVEATPEASAYEECTLTIITHFTNYVDTLFTEYDAAFEAAYPGITLEWQAYTDYDTDLRVMMNAGEYGDVLSNVDGVEVADFPTFYLPLGTVDEIGETYMFPNELEKDGTCYGIPQMVNAMGMVYNKAVFAAAGVEGTPGTPEEFLEDLQKIKDNTDAIPFYTNYAAGWTMSQWNDYRTGVAGDPDYINGVLPHIDDPFSEGRPDYIIYTLMYDIVANGLCEDDPYTTDWEPSKGMMNRGEIGVMALGSWAIGQMMDPEADGTKENEEDIGYMPFPYTQSDGTIYAKAGGDRKLCIAANSEHPAEARLFVDWFLNDSGFAQSQMAISPVVGADFPSVLDSFSEMGVVYLSDNPAPPEESGLLDSIDHESVNYWSQDFKWRIIDAAYGNTDETLDEIFADLNDQWAAAREELGVAD